MSAQGAKTRIDRPAVPDGVPSPTGEPTGDSDVARLRREQVLEAAEAIVASEGLPKLSLGRIERRTKMSRGQLTYYFPTKEAILIALFERMLRRMLAEAMADPAAPQPGTGRAWECATFAFTRKLDQPPTSRDFLSLLYTFLAQMNHREDFRRRLAGWWDEWRSMIAQDIETSVPAPRPVAPRVAASIIQALLNGLSMQLAVDPKAFDPAEMAEACLYMLAPLFGQSPKPPARVSHE